MSRSKSSSRRSRSWQRKRGERRGSRGAISHSVWMGALATTRPETENSCQGGGTTSGRRAHLVHESQSSHSDLQGRTSVSARRSQSLSVKTPVASSALPKPSAPRTRTHAALSAHGEFSPTQQHARSACHSHCAQPLQSVDRAHCSAARPKCAHAQVLVGNVNFFAPTNGYEAVLDREDVKQIINRRLNHPLYGGSVEEKRQVGLLSLSTHTSHPTTFRLPACTTLAPLCCP
jgi:hypothetical protein